MKLKNSITHFTLLTFVIFLLNCSCSAPNNEIKNNESIIVSIESPAKVHSGEPHLYSDQEGMVYMSWIEGHPEGWHILKFSKLVKEQWSSPQEIISGNNWFVNWADYPTLSVKPNGHMIAHLLVKSGPGTFAYDVTLLQSQDSGKSWSSPFTPHTDKTETEHGFVSILPIKDQFFATWLDGRNTNVKGGHGHGGEMSLRAAFINQDNSVENEALLDLRVCDCCQTGATLTEHGPVVVYRDRSEEEIRDISIVRYVNGNWTEPKSVYADGWKISGCPVNGPKVASIENKLAVAWFSAANSKPTVKIAFSPDNGETFSDPVRIDDGHPLGRVDLVMLRDGSVMISWLETENDETVIKVRKVNSDGNKEASIKIANTSSSRASGFPQMALSDNHLYFAWTNVEGDSTVIRTSYQAIKY
ncbi:sialidase family protein [Fulvivirgaceae bacterium BMA10]|uniref:Sialidase family protein n=1 Tax=Splendidivirga corallicola TaxID=3051826 RepID=A0ABT8KX55_9BACT|nr:sialidase family protein [Fulvivirgaceae bacterium BMA10]